MMMMTKMRMKIKMWRSQRTRKIMRRTIRRRRRIITKISSVF